MSMEGALPRWNGKLVIAFAVVAGASALATFTYFDNYPALVAGKRGPPLGGLFLLLLKSLFFSGPLILVAVLVWPVRALIIISSAHAAIFASLLAIVSITSRPGHSSLGDSLAPLIMTVLWLILAVEIALIFIALSRSRTDRPFAAFVSTFAGLTVPLVGGWAAGVLVWSETLPTQVIASAQALAGGRPYCLETDGQPLDSKRDLVAWSLLARNMGGYTHEFHALMVIESGADRFYANWSYRRGGFVGISDKSRSALHLDRKTTCIPSENFLVNL